MSSIGLGAGRECPIEEDNGRLHDFAAWAWARHHNEWSWYIRPLFLISVLLVRLAAQSGGRRANTLALATSMFWFPAPAVPSPMAMQLLAAERAYLFGEWTWWKIAVACSSRQRFSHSPLAFWKRSFVWGITVVNIIVLSKIAWSFAFFTVEGALYHLVPAALGLAICNLVLFIAKRWHEGWRNGRPLKMPVLGLSARTSFRPCVAASIAPLVQVARPVSWS